MKHVYHFAIALLTAGLLFSCNKSKEEGMKEFEKGTFGYDLNFLSKKDSLVILKSGDEQSQIIISAKYQGKIFTSTAEGLDGSSLGFIGYDALDATTLDEHMNGYGGENRFWLGPEGGQYSVYFEKGKEQIYDNWHTPKPIDSEAWDLVSANTTAVVMKKEMQVSNYVGTKLHLDVNRTVKILDKTTVLNQFELPKDLNVKVVAYETQNSITNLNDFEWTKQTGAICIWMLDMFIPAPKALTFIPFVQGEEKDLGTIATTNYFGEIPASHLQIKDGLLLLKTDGKHRAKLGMNGKRTKGIAGNYDPEMKRLTITTYDVEKDATYLNQEWNITKDPLVGDAMNAYNDGPLEDGSIMGPFLEIESCSPAAFLKPRESQAHTHKVFHFIGESAELTRITEKLMNVSIHDITNTFK